MAYAGAHIINKAHTQKLKRKAMEAKKLEAKLKAAEAKAAEDTYQFKGRVL